MSDFHVQMVGHASLMAQSGGKILLTDPWYVDPINCNSIYHWPPLKHSIQELAAMADAIYISHVHPDHFDPVTLEYFSKKIPIYIGNYSNKGFLREFQALGFENITECAFQQLVPVAGTPFQISIVESDYQESAAYDSSAIITCPEFTLFNNNDCYLEKHKYEWVAKNFKVDYGFLGYSHASFFPICFEFEPQEKDKLLGHWSEKHYQAFLDVAAMLRPKLSVPFAMGIRFLHPSMLWQNKSFNRAQTAISRLAAKHGLKGVNLMPGDKITKGGEINMARAEWPIEEEDRALEKYAHSISDTTDAKWHKEPTARPELIDRFRASVESIWAEKKSDFPKVAEYVIAYEITGPQGGSFHFDFSREKPFASGIPERFDMRYRYEDKLLQKKVDGLIDWDELNFSNRISVKQNRYAAEFYAMIRTDAGLWSRKSLD